MPAERPLRVALAIGTLELGGAETQVVGIARELKQRGHDVEVLVFADDGPLRDSLDAAGVPVFAVGLGAIRFRDARGRLRPQLVQLTAVPAFLRLFRHLLRRRYDVIHCYLFWSYVFVLPLAWLARVPVRISARRGLWDTLPPYPLRMPLSRLTTWMATAVIANAQAVADDARRAEGVPAQKLRVIPNAVDIPDERADPATEPPVGMIIANLIHYKGHRDLVAALALLDDPPKIRCIGEGPERDDLAAAIAAAGLTDVMLLEGRRFDAKALYLEAQFAVICSHSEGMPNAVLEAMAAGLPVVATDVGGCRELVSDGSTGLLVAPRDPAALAAAVRRVQRDQQFRVTAGELARATAANSSWAAVADAHLRCYRELLQPRQRSG